MAPFTVTGAERNWVCMAELLAGREDTLETLRGPLLVPQGSRVRGLPRGHRRGVGACPQEALGSRKVWV